MPTKWSFEVPINHLREFDDLQDYFFGLSFLLKDKDYEKYLGDKLDKGLVILDNSYNELQSPETPEEMAKLYYRYEHPNLQIVAPDSDKWSTEGLLHSHYNMGLLVDSSQVLYIYRNPLERNALQNYKNLAVSYEWRPFFPKGYPYGKEDHFLGLISPEEILKYKPRTCDTGMPIKIAIEGLSIDEWVYYGCPHIHNRNFDEYLNYRMSTKQIDLARTNIINLKRRTHYEE